MYLAHLSPEMITHYRLYCGLLDLASLFQISNSGLAYTEVPMCVEVTECPPSNLSSSAAALLSGVIVHTSPSARGVGGASEM
jgi:hypothetical protein